MSANENAPPERPAQSRSQRACPVCRKPRSDRYDPFCSKRCADVDLHRWLRGGYAIPGADHPAEADQGGKDE